MRLEVVVGKDARRRAASCDDSRRFAKSCVRGLSSDGAASWRGLNRWTGDDWGCGFAAHTERGRFHRGLDGRRFEEDRLVGGRRFDDGRLGVRRRGGGRRFDDGRLGVRLRGGGRRFDDGRLGVRLRDGERR